MSPQSLPRRIQDALIPSVFDRELPKFCPEHLFAGLLTKDDIIESERDDETSATESEFTISELAEWVYTNAPRIFVIMVYSRIFNRNAFRSLYRLREVGFTDTHLPITEKGMSMNGCLKFPLEIWKGDYEDQNLVDFYERQWAFLPTVFSQDVFHYELQRKAVLPFTWKGEEKTDVKQTASSEVRRYRMDGVHQQEGIEVSSHLSFGFFV